MRHLSLLALLLLFALPLAAQDADPRPVTDVPPVEITDLEERVEDVTIAALDDIRIGAIEVKVHEVEVRTDILEDVEVAALQPDRRNWWWTVGAIVTAGVILALVL